VKREVGEAAELQKQIRDMELELARIKATHPPENVSICVCVKGRLALPSALRRSGGTSLPYSA
jgi:hypothetical protein